VHLVVCATDSRYVEMTGVLIRSIASQPHATGMEIVVFCTQVEQSDKDRLAACSDGATLVTLIDLDESSLGDLEDLGGTRHLSMTVYARMMIPDLLPQRTGRALYLDCDIVVNTSLDPLFALDLSGHVVGAIPNVLSSQRRAELNAAIDRPSNEPYFNSGVLLIDLDRWRSAEVSQKSMAYARFSLDNYDADQAVLNKILTANWKTIDARWNSNPDKASPAQLRTMPIQHFWGRKKPYFSDYPAGLRERYDHYRAMTPWASSQRMTPLQRSFEKRMASVMKLYRRIAGS
jgi:lipopolysaccharide biosynthesis glycosyltransferase